MGKNNQGGEGRGEMLEGIRNGFGEDSAETGSGVGEIGLHGWRRMPVDKDLLACSWVVLMADSACLCVQLILADLALLSRSDTPTIISLVGNMVLYVICGLIGALTVAPYKYMWWVASLIFLIIVFMLLLQRLNNAEGYGGDALKGLTWLTILVWLVYPIVWIVGSEGTGALGLSQEVGIITIADLIAKIGFGFYLLANVDAPEAESAPLNQSSQQYV